MDIGIISAFTAGGGSGASTTIIWPPIGIGGGLRIAVGVSSTNGANDVAAFAILLAAASF